MKLYTEEQIKQAIAYCNTSYFVTPDDLLEDLSLKPIVLPSDEEIEAISKDEILYNDSKRAWWIEGAKYILQTLKIQLDEKIIKKAHDSITRIKGKEYAPTSNEIQKWIDNQNNK